MGAESKNYAFGQRSPVGIKPSTLPKHIRRAAGITLDASGRSRPKLASPVVGHVLLELDMEPPSVTHHDKEIVPRYGKGGVVRGHRLVDSPGLRAAREAYERSIPERRVLVPLRAPVALRVEFWFPWAIVRAYGSGRDNGIWMTDKPDLSNSIKQLEDLLALRGYIADDKHVSIQEAKKFISPHVAGCIRVYIRSLVSNADDGEELPYRGKRGEVELLPGAK
jgi:Holliday junction resolvase RusA-like endonuclease